MRRFGFAAQRKGFAFFPLFGSMKFRIAFLSCLMESWTPCPSQRRAIFPKKPSAAFHSGAGRRHGGKVLVMLCKPLPDGSVLVGGAEIYDGVDVPSDVHSRFGLLEELLAPIALRMVSDDRSVQHVSELSNAKFFGGVQGSRETFHSRAAMNTLRV